MSADRILAIDAATRSGWAAKMDGEITFGALDVAALCAPRMPGPRGKPSRGEKLAAAARAYADLMERCKPDVVLLEAPFARGVATTRLLYGYAGAVEAAAHRAGAACLELEPSSVRKRVLGRGKLEDGKTEVIEWARGQGFDLRDDQDDEADALMLLHAGLASVRVVPPRAGKRRG